MFEYIILDIIYVFTPFLLYILSSIYSYTINEKENMTILTFTILTSFYLIGRFGLTPYDNVLLLINLPLLLAYYKKQDKLVIFISLLLSIYYMLYFKVNLLILYTLLYIVNKKITKKNVLFISYVFLYLLIILITRKYSAVILYFFVVIISYIILKLLKLCENFVQLNNKVQQFEQEQQIKNNLFKITHEIKNPIAVCKGYLDMFDINNKKHLKYIPIIKDEIERTLFLLEDFLSMNKIKINKDILDINCLIEDVVNSFIPIFKSKKIQYKIKLCEDELFTFGDYNRLNQVLTNIIKNALESFDRGVIKITTKFEKDIIIIIQDNGCGMDKQMLERIKEPFYTTKKRGTGLGVSLSYEIIEAHNGNIVYNSKIDKGTTVKITLPFYEC